MPSPECSRPAAQTTTEQLAVELSRPAYIKVKHHGFILLVTPLFFSNFNYIGGLTPARMLLKSIIYTLYVVKQGQIFIRFLLNNFI